MNPVLFMDAIFCKCVDKSFWRISAPKKTSVNVPFGITDAGEIIITSNPGAYPVSYTHLRAHET